MFSFIKRAVSPRLMASGLWDCASPAWPAMDTHLRCNLIKECEDGRDEEGCRHQRCGHHWGCRHGSRCRHHGFKVGDHCYMLHRPDAPVSYVQAQTMCWAAGGILASFNSHAQLKAAVEVLWSRGHVFPFWIGFKSVPPAFLAYYKTSYMLDDLTMAYHLNRNYLLEMSRTVECGYLSRFNHEAVSTTQCSEPRPHHLLCELDSNPQPKPPMSQPVSIYTLQPDTDKFNVSVVRCPKGHVALAFAACDPRADCWPESDVIPDVLAQPDDVRTGSGCLVELPSFPFPFFCRTSGEKIPYTFVCDYRKHCFDESDEKFCEFREDPESLSLCVGEKYLPCGLSKQCYSLAEHCDGLSQCVNSADEKACSPMKGLCFSWYIYRSPPPSIIFLDGYGYLYITNNRSVYPLPDSRKHGRSFDWSPYCLEEYTTKFFERSLDFPLLRRSKPETPASFSCPETHFRCPPDGYCLPVFTRCNDVDDCPGREDEAGCGEYACPGHYRCRGSRSCVHPSQVCDGLEQCPEEDDELLCRLPPCPPGCHCYGLAYTCRTPFPGARHPGLRYLDGSGSGMGVDAVRANRMLVLLDLSSCRLTSAGPLRLFNLNTLDLSHNRLTHVSLRHLRHLRVLRLAGNPLASLFSLTSPLSSSWQVSLSSPSLSFSSSSPLSSSSSLSSPLSLSSSSPLSPSSLSPLLYLEVLDVSGTPMVELDAANLSLAFPALRWLSVAHSGLRRLKGGSLGPLRFLETVDLRGRRLEPLSPRTFSGLGRLRNVHAGDYKLCCPQLLPRDFNLKACRSQPDLVSSCHALLRSPLHSVSFSVVGALAVVGNAASLAYRGLVRGAWRSGRCACDEVVSHLSLADLVMGGGYLTVVRVADHALAGGYVWAEAGWRGGAGCATAGALGLLSLLLSVWLSALLGMLLAVGMARPPLSLSPSPRAARVACCLLGAACTALTLGLSLATRWTIYGGASGLCLALAAVFTTSTTTSSDTTTTTNNDSDEHHIIPALTVMVASLIVPLILSLVAQLYVFATVTSESDVISLFRCSPSRAEALSRGRRLSPLLWTHVTVWLTTGCVLLLWRQDLLPRPLAVAMVTVVVPARAALTPVLYAAGVQSERHRHVQHERLMQRLGARAATGKAGKV